jgi:aquaporin Z
MFHRLAAEMIGTFWLVLGGCGSAVFAAKFLSGGVSVGIGFLGVALAFGLTVLTGVYAFGTISGGHFNPAVAVDRRACRVVAGVPVDVAGDRANRRAARSAYRTAGGTPLA